MTKFIAVAALCASIVASCMAAGDGWLTSYSDAVKQSKKTGKPIMADFTGSDWCMYCKKLDEEVFSKPAFKQWAAKNVILLQLDYPHYKALPAALTKQNQELGQKYREVRGYPTILFLKADGTAFGMYGYERGGADRWVKMASRLLPLQNKS